MSIIENVIGIILKTANENNLKSITKVTLNIGKLRQVVPDFLIFAFQTATKNTIAENAKLEILEIPIKMRCKTCGLEFLVENHVYICPKCENTNLEILTGNEITIASIEGDSGDEKCK